MKSRGPEPRAPSISSIQSICPVGLTNWKIRKKGEKLNHSKNNDMENMACLNLAYLVETRRPCTSCLKTSQEKSVRTWKAHLEGFLRMISQIPRTWLSWMMSLDLTAPESLFVLKFIRLVLNSMQIFTIYNVLWLGVSQCIWVNDVWKSAPFHISNRFVFESGTFFFIDVPYFNKSLIIVSLFQLDDMHGTPPHPSDCMASAICLILCTFTQSRCRNKNCTWFGVCGCKPCVAERCFLFSSPFLSQKFLPLSLLFGWSTSPVIYRATCLRLKCTETHIPVKTIKSMHW